MHQRSRRIRILGATTVVALAVLANGAAGNTTTHPKTLKQLAQLGSISDRDGDATYVWIVDGVQRGLPMK